MSGRRLDSGGRIDRDRPISFTFNGKSLTGYAGDTLASALLANGVSIVGRSFKYHRPRGVLAAGAEEPNAIVQLFEGDRTVPNPKATQVELVEGLVASSVNCWPSVDYDIGAINGLVSKALPAGFYYKTFMWPRTKWESYEKIIRAAAGLGKVPDQPDPDYYEKVNAHTDVLVVGSGPAGLAAALSASRAGARVLLVDESSEFGGSLLGSTELINEQPAATWIEAAVAELASNPDVQMLDRTTAFGYYDHNFLNLAQRVTDHLDTDSAGSLPRERLWRVRAAQVVIATGALERPLVFGNNDRPGVMLASAVSTYVNRYGVSPGSEIVVFTNNDSAYRVALDLNAAGVSVKALVDSRARGAGAPVDEIKAAGIDLITSSVVSSVRGARGVKAVDVHALTDDGTVSGSARRIDCDVVAMSGGWSPVVHLHAQSGGRPRYDDVSASFVPGVAVQSQICAGACNGDFLLHECLSEGAAAGVRAAAASGYDASSSVEAEARVATNTETALEPLWLVPAPKEPGRGPKQFLDYQNDTTAADIRLAVREGFRSIEHVKRYTLLGFGTDQGKLGNINGMAIAAKALGQTIEETGTTTFRPAYTPVTFGTWAGRGVGEFFDPVRKTPMHPWHEERGAEFEDVGQWKRPWFYPEDGEDMHAAVARECLATRNAIGVVDASTLGKIDVRGRDAGAFLDRIYTNMFSSLKPGHCRYGLMLHEDGMVMDDGVSARIADDHYYMTTTTGGAAHVLGWMEQWLQTEWPEMEVYLTSVTDQWATISLSGPKARALCEELSEDIDYGDDAFPFMTFRQGRVAGAPARVFRISFSGERSYEINVPANYGLAVWQHILDAGEKYGITPYGTETMHVLRAEKGFIIVGQDTDGSVTPIDLGMNWVVSKKKDFLGKRSLFRSDTVREDRKQLVGLLTEHDHEVLPEGAQLVEVPSKVTPVPMVGHVTSSYFSPSLNRSIALALVKDGRRMKGESVFAPLIDGRLMKATIVDSVFYDPKGDRQNV